MNRWQMLGFLLANLCGMTIVLVAVQFYTDVIPLFTKSDSFIKPGQVVITKHVVLLPYSSSRKSTSCAVSRL